jgi:hypothetical protein
MVDYNDDNMNFVVLMVEVEVVTIDCIVTDEYYNVNYKFELAVDNVVDDGA